MPQQGDTPLYNAAGMGHADVVQLLLEAGANKEAAFEVGRARALESEPGATPAARSGGRAYVFVCVCHRAFDARNGCATFIRAPSAATT